MSCAAPNFGRVFRSVHHPYLPDWRGRERSLRAICDLLEIYSRRVKLVEGMPLEAWWM